MTDAKGGHAMLLGFGIKFFVAWIIGRFLLAISLRGAAKAPPAGGHDAPRPGAPYTILIVLGLALNILAATVYLGPNYGYMPQWLYNTGNYEYYMNVARYQFDLAHFIPYALSDLLGLYQYENISNWMMYSMPLMIIMAGLGIQLVGGLMLLAARSRRGAWMVLIGSALLVMSGLVGFVAAVWALGYLARPSWSAAAQGAMAQPAGQASHHAGSSAYTEADDYKGVGGEYREDPKDYDHSDDYNYRFNKDDY